MAGKVKVDTTKDFHTYTITVTPEGDISVSQGGTHILDGSTFSDSQNNGDVPRVGFGDGTMLAHGVSEWEYFQHDAVGKIDCPTPTPKPGALWADVDCDGAVAIGDAVKLARWLIDLSVSQDDPCPDVGEVVGVQSLAPDPQPDPIDVHWADADCDGAVAIGDAVKLARSLISLSVSQAEGSPLIGDPVAIAMPEK